MKDEHLIPLILFGSLLLIMLVIMITGFLIMHKQRTKQFKMKLKEQEYYYQNVLLTTRMEVQEEVLNRVSREIHDNVGQVLSITRMKLLNATDNKNKMEMRTGMEEASILLKKATKDLRNLSHMMNGGLMEQLDLKSAIEKEMEYIHSLYGVPCTLSYPHESVLLTKEQQLLLFRIVQEALTNIIKHARATSIRITAMHSENKLTLSIADNGIGIDPDKWQNNSGLGLISIQQRVQLLNGKMDLQTGAGEGTVITVWFKI